MRGTGSLQQLLGRSTFTSSLRKRKAENVEAGISDSGREAAHPSSSTAAPDPALKPTLESPLKAGFVRCPVCQKQLEHKHGDEYINTHLDKCLLKMSTARNAIKQQATMLLFAQKTTPSPAVPSTSPENQAQQEEEQEEEIIVIKDDNEDDDSHESWGVSSLSPNAKKTGKNIISADASPDSCQQEPLPPKQQQHQQRQPQSLQLTSCLVGRQFQKGSSAVHLHPGDRLAVQHEPNNPRDRNALLVSTFIKSSSPPVSSPPITATEDNSDGNDGGAGTGDGDCPVTVAPVATRGPTTAEAAMATEDDTNTTKFGIALGHIPAVVAKHLGSLARQNLVTIEAVVLDKNNLNNSIAVRSTSSSIPLELHITPVLPPPTSASLSTNAAIAMVQRAVHAAAAATGAAAGGNGRGNTLDNTTDGNSYTSGDRLRCNFKALVSTVCKHDAHVLAEEELTFLKNYEAASVPAQCLFLRLSQRAGPFFRISSLNYAEVVDPLASAVDLQKLGLVSLSSTTCTAEVQWSEVAEVLPVPELQAVLSRLMVVNANNNNKNNKKSSNNNGNYASASTKNKNGGGGSFLPPPPSTRAAVLSALQRRADAPAPPASRAAVLRELLSTSGPIIKILSSSYTALDRFQRLFFLNEGHSLGQFLATDAGAVRYPSYPLTRQSPAFPTRDHFLRYEIALKQAEVLTTALEEGDLEAAEVAVAPAWAALDAGQHKEIRTFTPVNPPPHSHSNTTLFLRRYDAAWVYCMMATAGVSILEKQKRYRDAADRLQQLLGGNCCPSRRGQWWLRLSTDLEHLGRPNDALEIGEAALADETLSPGDRLAIQRRVLRLGKPPRRWKKPSWATSAQREPREVRIEGRPLLNNIGIKSKFYGFDGEQCSVEELALQYYASSTGGEYTGAHTEGGIWATLFGLLLWPQLFSLPVPDAFRTPFQTAPLDLDSDGFYAARMPEIEAQLAVIASGAAPALIASIWEGHLGTLCRGVNWERWSLEELQEIASCVGGPGLAAVCRLLASDHAGWQGGMPDLLLWHPEKVQAKLVEVKGPRDRLSDQQRAWIAALEDAGLAVEVLKVIEPKIK